MANRRLDWLVYTIMHRIVPYYVRNLARNTRDQDECDMMAHVHATLADDDDDDGMAASDAAPPRAGPPAAPRAPRSQLWRVAVANKTIADLVAELLSSVQEVSAAGYMQGATAEAATYLRRGIAAVKGVAHGAPPTFLSNAGDNLTERKDPPALKERARGGKGKRTGAAAAEPGEAPAKCVKLLPNKATGGKAKPKQLLAQLKATPGAPSPAPPTGAPPPPPGE